MDVHENKDDVNAPEDPAPPPAASGSSRSSKSKKNSQPAAAPEPKGKPMDLFTQADLAQFAEDKEIDWNKMNT